VAGSRLANASERTADHLGVERSEVPGSRVMPVEEGPLLLVSLGSRKGA